MNGSSLLCLGEFARSGTVVCTLHPTNPFKYTLGWDGKGNSILLWNKCNFLFVIMFIWQAEQLETRKTINRNDSSDIFSEKKRSDKQRKKAYVGSSLALTHLTLFSEIACWSTSHLEGRSGVLFWKQIMIPTYFTQGKNHLLNTSYVVPATLRHSVRQG